MTSLALRHLSHVAPVLIALSVTLLVASPARAETLIDFEELNQYDATLPAPFGFQLLGAGDAFNGYAAEAPTGSFRSQIATFPTEEFGPGFSYSRFSNIIVPGFTNPFAAWPGGGSNGDGGETPGSNYAIAFTGASVLLDGTPTNGTSVTFDSPVIPQSVDIANTTYATQYFANGLDGFSPEPDPLHQFVDGDFFALTITGFDGVDGTGNATGSIDVDLARFAGAILAGEDYLNDWSIVDLSTLGVSRSLQFATTSSQITDGRPTFGINHDVPAYVAIDNLRITAVPEPATVVGLAVVCGLAAIRRRWRQSVSGA